MYNKKQKTKKPEIKVWNSHEDPKYQKEQEDRVRRYEEQKTMEDNLKVEG